MRYAKSIHRRILGRPEATWFFGRICIGTACVQLPHVQPGSLRSMPDAHKIVATPIGNLRLVAGERGLMAIDWHVPSRQGTDGARARSGHPILREAERQLHEYFGGRRKVFALPLDFRGTPFQKRVWEALLEIPFGQTRSYGEIARNLGNANASRAVGAANGRNPLPIVVPCHRVIGASGDLTGFGGGLERKARLLDFERGTLTFDFGDARAQKLR